MKICIISGSTRQKSSSLNVSRYIQTQLEQTEDTEVSIFNLAEYDLPMWSEETDVTQLASQKEQLQQADGFVFVVPEWHGMAPPAVKNLFFLFSGVFRHKPAYLVGISSGTGGRYPIPEMRMSTYKNSFINYLPVNAIIDRVNKVISEQGEYIAETEFVRNRVDEGVNLLVEYSKAFANIRQSEIVQEKRFPNGV